MEGFDYLLLIVSGILGYFFAITLTGLVKCWNLF